MKSDNASCQYKSKWVFRFWEQFSIGYSLIVILYFDVKGNGKGLVDGMSSFCVKEPVRNAILTDDWWYTCASELADFLSCKFPDNDNKCYYLIDQDDLQERQPQKKKQIPLDSTWL